MRLILCFAALLLLGGPAPSPSPKPKPTAADDVLGDVVVEATEPGRMGPRLMKVVVPPVVGKGQAAPRVDAVLRRDLDLSGQLRLLDPSKPEAFQAAEAIIRVSTRQVDVGVVELSAAVFFDAKADVPAHEAKTTAALLDLRVSTHRLVDDLLRVLTGYRGPFVSRLTFVGRRGDTRAVYVIDPDGYGLRRITQDHQLAAASAFGPDDVLYYSASVRHGRYQVYREGHDEPLVLDPVGSVYGIAFSPDRTRVALTIARGADLRLYTGASDLTNLQPSGDLPLTLSPAIAARGSIAVAGTRKVRPRIWVDGRPASPRGATASAPDFCEHPDGTKLVYALGSRRRSAIVVADRRGRGARKITGGRGRNSHPACSPDGRLVAFFSDGRGGPGLYVMRIDGYHVRKIANVRGDSLRWSRLSTDSRGTAP